MTTELIRLDDSSAAASGGASGGDTAGPATALVVAGDERATNDATGREVTTDHSSLSASASSTYLGIDFGTSNSAAAIWDSTRGHAKWLRLGRHELATRCSGSSSKAGRIVPSAVLFISKKAAIAIAADFPTLPYEDISSIFRENKERHSDDNADDDDVVAFVGAAAIKLVEQAAVLDNSKKKNESLSFPYSSEQVSRALVTSVKRILGMRHIPNQSSTSSGKNGSDNDDSDDQMNNEWIESLPFELVMGHDTMTTTSSMTSSKDDDGEKDDGTVAIRVYPLGMTLRNASITVTPEQVVAILLQSIRRAAQDYLKDHIVKKRLSVPGNSWHCNNCVLGVPANVGQAQRKSLLRAAHLAGFGGDASSGNSDHGSNDTEQQQQHPQQHGVKVVSVLTESTAAAMAYGLFVSAGAKRKGTNNSDDQNGTTAATSILVFDMGGGTTDVTIAEMSSASSTTSNNDNVDDNDDSSLLPRFEVKVTHGDAHLGGDDMDEALLRTVLTKLAKQGEPKNSTPTSSKSLSPSEHRSLLRQCRSAKERLCGDVDHGLTKPEECVTITMASTGKRVDITQHDLAQALQPCLQRAEQVVQTALERYAAMLPSSSTTAGESDEATEENTAKSRRPPISEVVLVGGATRVLGVRDMLQRLFPPPPDLCLSVNAMSAVAQGTAIKAAMDSKCIPLHELRSAMMLDTTPHAIGVLLDNNNNKHQPHQNHDDQDEITTLARRFVEIIPRDDPLPATGVATFQLADARQPGISLRAVEKVLELDHHQTEKGRRRRRLLYPKLGDFTFLLHRLSDQQIAKLKDGIRSVDVSMTLKGNGELVVSYFDENDPEHMARRQHQQQQQQKKRRPKRDNASASDQAVVLAYASSKNGIMNNVDMDKDEGFSKDQMVLIGYCIILLLLYVTAKLVFHEELKQFKEES
jgi:molecular chaperone DnaK (HSP70)